MSTRPLVVITTRFPPATCGIGTYSALLRKHWPAAGAAVEVLVVDGAAAASAATADHVVEFGSNGARLTRELQRVGAADVVLHYAGRAYQRLGCPLWLPGVIAKWKRQFRNARLMLIVHELPGAMPLRSRHYWLGRINSWIVRRLAAQADVLVTNTASHAAKLRQISGRADVHLLPVGSNIEPGADMATPRSATDFVVFGLSFGRLQTLQQFSARIQQWHADGRLTKLHIIGPRGDDFTGQADELVRGWPPTLEVTKHGELSSAAVSQLLRTARFALTNVSEATWSKSGTFMACAAHRCAVVLAENASLTPPLSFVVRADEVATIAADELERRTRALERWYRENADWPVIAARMASLWQGGAPRGE